MNCGAWKILCGSVGKLAGVSFLKPLPQSGGGSHRLVDETTVPPPLWGRLGGGKKPTPKRRRQGADTPEARPWQRYGRSIRHWKQLLVADRTWMKATSGLAKSTTACC